MTGGGLAALRTLSTTDVSDALDRLGLAGQCFGVRPLDRSFRMMGRAFTVRYEPVDASGGTVGDYIDDVAPGDVVVIDNAGRLDVTVWGDLMTSVAARRGLGGTLIDGICRDADRSLELGYPIFSRGNWMRTGKDRVRLAAIGEPVEIGGVPVAPGDFVLGDADGVVVVAAQDADRVIAAATEIKAAEDQIRALIDVGVGLKDARSRLGYHALQTRR